MVTEGCGHGDSRLWSWWSWWQQVVIMATAGCGHGDSRLWSCCHGDSRLWSWWSWRQQIVVMVTAGCGHGGHGDSRLWSWDYARATTDSTLTCSRKWSWQHHQPATAVLKTRRPNIYCRDARFCGQREQTCGQQQSRYTPHSTAARRNWRRQLHSSCRLDSQCSGHREEKRNRLGQLPYNASCSTVRLATLWEQKLGLLVRQTARRGQTPSTGVLHTVLPLTTAITGYARGLKAVS